VAKDAAMNVSLTPELEKIVAERVASGRYASAIEVIAEALHLLDRRERLQNRPDSEPARP
jgi:antitoxin ParD1/3/4